MERASASSTRKTSGKKAVRDFKLNSYIYMKKQERLGEPITHKKIHRVRKNLKQIRGIYNAWKRARRYTLRLEAAHHVKVYVTDKGLLGKKDEAKKFAEGFDDFEVKRKYWQDKLGVRLIIERV